MTLWVPGEAGAVSEKRHAPATLRNRDDIVTVLRDMLSPSGLVLEVASGSGEHAVHFAVSFPHLDWQPTDPDPAALSSIAAWAAEASLPNLRAPLRLDAMAADWPVTRADAILCINMAHISPWEATVGLFTQAARLLEPGAPLILYGPWFSGGVPAAPSNMEFDANLRARDPAWGVRQLEQADALAARTGFHSAMARPMPANNLTLLFGRAG